MRQRLLLLVVLSIVLVGGALAGSRYRVERTPMTWEWPSFRNEETQEEESEQVGRQWSLLVSFGDLNRESFMLGCEIDPTDPDDSPILRGRGIGLWSPWVERRPAIEQSYLDSLPLPERYWLLIDELREEVRCWTVSGCSPTDLISSDENFTRLLALGRLVVPLAIADLKENGPCEAVLRLLDACIPSVLAECRHEPKEGDALEKRTLWLRWWDAVGARECWEW